MPSAKEYLEAEIKRWEDIVAGHERTVEEDKKSLDNAKAELEKAKEALKSLG